MRSRRPSRWLAPLAAATVVVALVALVVALALRNHASGQAAAARSPAASPAPTLDRRASSPTPAPAPSPSPSRSLAPSAAAARTARPAPRSSPPPKPKPAPPRASPPVIAGAAGAVLAVINQARAQAGLPAYAVLSGLVTSAGRHDQAMAGGCGLSHQCPGEPALGARETAAGVHWTEAAENIGDGGPVADTTAAISQMAVKLTQLMLAEKPPDDGHRQNILSKSLTHVGIVVIRDSDGTVWMTQDFSS